MTPNLFKFRSRQAKMLIKRALGILKKKWDLEVGEILQPSLDIWRYLGTPKCVQTQKTIDQVGWFNTFIQVPSNKRYHVIGIDINRDSGTFTFSRVGAYDQDGFNRFMFTRSTGKTTYQQMFTQPVILDPDQVDQFSVYCDAHSVNGTLDFNALIIEEDLNPV